MNTSAAYERMEDAMDAFEDLMESLEWEIEDEFGNIDTDHFDGVCVATDGVDTYYAPCVINRGSDDICGTIVSIEYAEANTGRYDI